MIPPPWLPDREVPSTQAQIAYDLALAGVVDPVAVAERIHALRLEDDVSATAKALMILRKQLADTQQLVAVEQRRLANLRNTIDPNVEAARIAKRAIDAKPNTRYETLCVELKKLLESVRISD